ncbi:MAG TPA: hypothetical protein VD906_06220 [Caulobacteraceae bacterium]|nr:hypothetical protein [Caulobacteraceae bacterium]
MEDDELRLQRDQGREPANRRGLLLGGAALALLGGLGVAFAILLLDDGPDKRPPPPASRGGLIVEAGLPDEDKLDPARPLRCFVDAQFVGELTLAQCAERNGVATGSLDVGLDQSGALAAANVAGTVLTPLPPPSSSAAPVNPAPAATPAAASDVCWRYEGGWRELGEMPRGACVQTLFAGQCAGRGQALYGRWGEQSLRLVTGRVEISGDNRRFRTLVEQGPACSVPAVD